AHKAVAKKGKRARKAAPERKRHARPVGNAETPAAKVKRGEKQAAPKQAKKTVKAGDEEGEADEPGEAVEPDLDLAAPDVGDDEVAAKEEDQATRQEKAEQEEEDAYSKSNDPVRMYLRKMGSVSLLTREGEVEIAKRIEDGEKEVLEAVLHSSIAIKEIIQIGERLRKGKMRVREVIRDAPDEDDETFDEQGRTDQVVKLIDKIRRLDRENEHYG